MPEFLIRFTIEGTYEELVTAPTIEDAKAAADAKIEDENWFPDLDSITNADHYVSQLFRVQRKDGSVVKTTYVGPTDTLLEDG